MAACRNIAEQRLAPATRQRGVGLLVILIIAGVLGVVFVTTVIGGAPNDAQRDDATQVALARAKEALISYAVTYMNDHPDDVPGYLPCPDLGTPSSVREGAAAGTCGAAYTGPALGDNSMGRLPWYTLGIEPLRDGYGECLWYAVSSTYKNSPEPAILNWDSIGRFRIMGGPNGTTVLVGATTADLVVAVIVAPGPAFGSQVRAIDATDAPSCGGNYTASNYLDTGPGSVNNAAPAASGQADFIQGARTNTFNDRLVYITVQDIWNAVVRRTDLQTQFQTMTQQVAFCIARYSSIGAFNYRSLPWAVSQPQAGYTLATNYDDTDNTRFGRAPYDVDRSNNVSGFANDTLLASTAAGGRCATWSARDDKWWKHWKDHFFYGLSSRFEVVDAPPQSCGASCLRVNSSGQYAGVVLFAGRANAGQNRITDAQKGDPANYLEGDNADGDLDYSSTGGSTFNDVVYCINPSSSPSPPVSGAVPTTTPPPSPKFWVHQC